MIATIFKRLSKCYLEHRTKVCCKKVPLNFYSAHHSAMCMTVWVMNNSGNNKRWELKTAVD